MKKKLFLEVLHIFYNKFSFFNWFSLAITKEARNIFKQMEENGFQEKNKQKRV